MRMAHGDLDGLQKEQLARYIGRGLVGAQERNDAAPRKALDGGAELILTIGLEGDTSLDHLAVRHRCRRAPALMN